MVGDPSGKTAERQFLDVEVLQHNLACQKAQLERFLDFEGPAAARVVNNYDWFQTSASSITSATSASTSPSTT